MTTGNREKRKEKITIDTHIIRMNWNNTIANGNVRNQNILYFMHYLRKVTLNLDVNEIVLNAFLCHTLVTFRVNKSTLIAAYLLHFIIICLSYFFGLI